jgi:hypothetical protein
MILRTEDGDEIEWDITLDRDSHEALARWRAFVEAKLSMPAGTVAGFQWNDDGDMRILVRREKLLG